MKVENVVDSMDLSQQVARASKFFDTFNKSFKRLYNAEDDLNPILGGLGKDIKVAPPLNCEIGSNTYLGDGVHLNIDTALMDKKGKIHIGNRVLTGPFLRILTEKKRDNDETITGDVHIEEDVWMGGGVTIYPGVRIGRGSVIAAGAVVTKDIPANVLAVGFPARPIIDIDQKSIPEDVELKEGETHRERMINGRVFYSSDPELKKDKQKAYEFFTNFNELTGEDNDSQGKLLKILGSVGSDPSIKRPFYFSYGYQIFIGQDVKIDSNVFLGDAAMIKIGNRVDIGSGVQIYTTNHCLQIPYRGYIVATDVKIEDDVVIGRDSIILPGVTVGKGSIIKEGSVVKDNVPPNSIVSGVPAKIESKNK